MWAHSRTSLALRLLWGVGYKLPSKQYTVTTTRDFLDAIPRDMCAQDWVDEIATTDPTELTKALHTGDYHDIVLPKWALTKRKPEMLIAVTTRLCFSEHVVPKLYKALVPTTLPQPNVRCSRDDSSGKCWKSSCSKNTVAHTATRTTPNQGISGADSQYNRGRAT